MNRDFSNGIAYEFSGKSTPLQMRIRCPKCDWEPDGGAYWQCHCGCVWNTFETAARCPSCGFQHRDTQCPPFVGGCEKFSLHLDWYEGLDEKFDELSIKETVPK